MTFLFRPRLRAVEVIIVPDDRMGRAILLRDTEGIAPSAIAVAAHLGPVLARFDGTRTAEEIASEAGCAGVVVDAAAVSRLAADLDRALMLDSPRFREERKRCIRAFAGAEVREASHAGGAYHGDADELRRYIDDACLGKAAGSPPRRERLLGVCAPHMDLWRAAVGYGHAYRALAAALQASLVGVDTIFVLGTSHAPMRRAFAVCDKPFVTPLGRVDPDRDVIREITSAASFDVLEDAYNHVREHSIEFQIVFLQHLLGARPTRIVPILCGLGASQASGRDPVRDAEAEPFVRAVHRAFERRADRALVVAGADLAHVGPRFGDPEPLDAEGRKRLDARDRETVDHVLDGDAKGFFGHAVADLDARRVCGVGPIYTLLRALGGRTRGQLFSYVQCVDPVEGSIVSHASIGFYA